MGVEVLVARLDAGTVQLADGVEHLALTPADGHTREGGEGIVGSGGAGRRINAANFDPLYKKADAGLKLAGRQAGSLRSVARRRHENDVVAQLLGPGAEAIEPGIFGAPLPPAHGRLVDADAHRQAALAQPKPQALAAQLAYEVNRDSHDTEKMRYYSTLVDDPVTARQLGPGHWKAAFPPSRR